MLDLTPDPASLDPIETGSLDQLRRKGIEPAAGQLLGQPGAALAGGRRGTNTDPDRDRRYIYDNSTKP